MYHIAKNAEIKYIVNEDMETRSACMGVCLLCAYQINELSAPINLFALNNRVRINDVQSDLFCVHVTLSIINLCKSLTI